jgi:hypothetical protein
MPLAQAEGGVGPATFSRNAPDPPFAPSTTRK